MRHSVRRRERDAIVALVTVASIWFFGGFLSAFGANEYLAMESVSVIIFYAAAAYLLYRLARSGFRWSFKRMDRNSNDRGQSYAYIIAGATIILFAGAYAVLNDPATQLLDEAAGNCISSQCTTGVGYVRDTWTWAPLWAVGLVVIMILSVSVYKSRRPTR